MSDQNPRAWMLAEAVQFLKMADRLQSQFFQIGRSSRVLSWEPPVDMYGGGEELGICVALPGVAADSFEVTLEDEAIVVSGERSLRGSSPYGPILRLEIPYGRFERRIPLPFSGYRMVDRQLVNGCLTVVLERVK